MAMFSSVFDWIVLSSVMGSILVLLILAVKFALKNTLGANWHYYIWFLLLLRLIIPFTPESVASMYNLANFYSLGSVISNSMDGSTPMHYHGIQLSDSENMETNYLELLPSNPEQDKVDATDQPISDFKLFNWKNTIIIFWLIGVVLVAGYTIFINIKLRNQIKAERLMNIASVTELFETCKSEIKISNNIPIISTNLIGVFPIKQTVQS